MSFGIEPELAQTFDDLVLDGVIEQRIDDDDARARRDGPRRELCHADEIEIVEHLYGLRVPRLARRCRARSTARRGNGSWSARQGQIRSNSAPCSPAAAARQRCGARPRDSALARHCPRQRAPRASQSLKLACSLSSQSLRQREHDDLRRARLAGELGRHAPRRAATSDGPVVTATYCLPSTANDTG